MKMKLLQIGLLAAALLAPVTLTIRGANRTTLPAPDLEKATRTGKLTLFHGPSKLVKVEGVGCTRSICSRTLIKGWAKQAADSIAIDQIDMIQDTTPSSALFVLKDGTERRLSLLNDFRVLYLQDESGKLQRVDVREIKSLDFLPTR